MSQASQKQIKSRHIERVTSNQKYIRFKPVPSGVANAVVNPNSQQKISLENYAQSKYNQIIRQYKTKDEQADLASTKYLSMSDLDLKKQRICQFSCPQSNLQLDPIDEKIRIPFQSNYYGHMFRHNFKSSFQPFKEELRDWLIDVIQITCSITLNHLKMHRFNQKEAKNFASKNILLNIKEFFERHSSIPLQHRFELMNFINTQSHRIFTKISYKYPQNGQVGVSKRLKSQIHKIDNRDSDEFDFLFCHKINITYRQDADYSQDIMKVINKLISITADVFDTNDPYQQSNYEVFTGIMEYIFQNASSQSATATANTLGEMIKERKITKGQDFLMEFKSAAFDDYFQNSYARDQLVKKSESIKQSSRKVLFGQKIPSGTRQFTEDEINGEYFKIHHSSILRILTKWADQLRSKFQNAEETILKRIYKVKDFNGNLMNMEIDLRTKLYEAALEEFHNVQEYLDYLKKENIYMQTLFAEEINVGKYCKNDTKVGTFAAKINEISSQYMFKYINQLIHSLLSIPKKAAEKAKNDRDKFNLSCANLVTLKIGDLMRCRCATTQKEFIKILNALEQTSMKNSKILKIIRIKNRLQQQSNDLLINLFFANKVECQLQLSVDNHYHNLDKSVSSFNHYVYQIIRAELGPISELSIIIAQYDSLVNIFSKKEGFSPDLVQGICNVETQRYKQARLEERMKFKAKINIGKKLQLPFVCWNCSRLSIVNNSAFLYRDPESLKRQCNECLISRLKKGDNFEPLQLQYIIKHNFLKRNEQQFMKRHLTYQQYDKFIERLLINNRQNADNLQSVGMLMKRNQKRPNLILFNAVYEKTTSKILLGSFNKGQKVKLIINVPVNVNQKKRQDILKRQFSNYFVFQCKNINKLINRGQIYFQCNDERCCRAKISLGSHINQEQIKNLANRKLIQEHFQNQKSTVYLNNTPKAFEIVETVLSELDPHKRGKVCSSIKGIEAYNCSLQSIEVVSRFANIYELNISNNAEITSLKGIEDCQKLKILDCKRCSLTNINEISGLKRLEHLNLSHNKSLEDINGLASLTELKKVYLNNTQISTLQPLQKCNKLQILDIQECKNIKSISDITSEHLNYLILVNCGLQSFDLPLQSTSNLKVIEIYSEQSQNQEMMRKIKSGMKINLLKRKDSSVQMKIDDIIFNLAKLIIMRKRSSEDDD